MYLEFDLECFFKGLKSWDIFFFLFPFLVLLEMDVPKSQGDHCF